MRAKSLVFYGCTTVALLLIVTKQHKALLPDGLATQIGHNSEALVLAVLVCAAIQWLHPIPTSRRRWIMSTYAGGCFVVAYLLATLPLLPSLTTLNEAVFAAGVLALYFQIPRPMRMAPVISLAVVVLVVLLFNTDFVLNQAESLVVLILAPIGFDVADRTILEPSAPSRPVRRAVWCVALLVLWLGLRFVIEGARTDLSGPVALGADYAYRATEAYFALLLVHIYFSFWLGRDWQKQAHRREARGRTVPTA